MEKETHIGYWDCECDTDYQHDKKYDQFCEKCGTEMDEQPDSIVSELVETGIIKKED